MTTLTALRYLQDLWDEKAAAALDEPELLRYRSNLLGADLRITNFAGGNTSSKVAQRDPPGRRGAVGQGQRRRSGQH
jgi:rhamnose utilization protein RhaD (predicted bifunctional aldolase and dehydrogenase)